MSSQISQQPVLFHTVVQNENYEALNQTIKIEAAFNSSWPINNDEYLETTYNTGKESKFCDLVI